MGKIAESVMMSFGPNQLVTSFVSYSLSSTLSESLALRQQKLNCIYEVVFLECQQPDSFAIITLFLMQ